MHGFLYACLGSLFNAQFAKADKASCDNSERSSLAGRQFRATVPRGLSAFLNVGLAARARRDGLAHKTGQYDDGQNIREGIQ